jgi:serine/threonine-protein kinase
VWSVGVMLYELLSGVHPFTGETPNAIMANAIKEPLPPLRDAAPHVPEPLAKLVERCLEKEPENRPQTAGEMLEELRAVLAEVELDETVPAAPTPPSSWSSGDEPDIAISSSFPIEARRQANVRTEIVDREEPRARSVREAEPSGGSRRPLVLGLAVVATLGLAAVGGAAIYWAVTGEPEAGTQPQATAMGAAEQTAGAEVRGEPTEPSEPEVAPSESEEAEEPDEEAVAAPGGGAAEPEAGETDEEPGSDEAASERPGARQRRAAARTRAAARARESEEPEEPEGPTALEEARACLARGDQACARGVLESRARTATEHAMLIDLYRSSGRIPQALDAMERFVRRFRRARQTPEYREYLRRYGR